MDPDARTRTAIEEHWRASERGDTEAEHAIYADDAILDYPQSGERFRGRAAISAHAAGILPAGTSSSCGSLAPGTCG
jgi:ketosteroid isomerase-like protein